MKPFNTFLVIAIFLGIYYADKNLRSMREDSPEVVTVADKTTATTETAAVAPASTAAPVATETAVPQPTPTALPIIEPVIEPETAVVFEFTASEPTWYTLNDDVMGGISSSEVQVDINSGVLNFDGNVSLENNGGFASIRSQAEIYDLGEYDGITIRVRGDGNVYRFRIRTEKTGPEISYTAVFPTEANTWQDIYIPFADMLPLYRGFVVQDAGPLDASTIRSFGFMMTDKQEGEFSLEVDRITAVKSQNAPESIQVQ